MFMSLIFLGVVVVCCCCCFLFVSLIFEIHDTQDNKN